MTSFYQLVNVYKMSKKYTVNSPKYKSLIINQNTAFGGIVFLNVENVHEKISKLHFNLHYQKKNIHMRIWYTVYKKTLPVNWKYLIHLIVVNSLWIDKISESSYQFSIYGKGTGIAPVTILTPHHHPATHHLTTCAHLYQGPHLSSSIQLPITYLQIDFTIRSLRVMCKHCL